MDTKNLVTLITIAETGSFQRAAAQLNYAPSTVTSQIRQLETELSIRLFEKVGRKMELTQTGREVLPLVRTILKNVEQIRDYKENTAEITGTLRLVAPDTIFVYVMQPMLKAIMQKAPQVQLIFNSVPSDEVSRAIVERTADIGIDCDREHFPDEVLHPAGKAFQACLVASPLLAPAARDFLSPHQKKPISMILNEPNANYQKEIADYFERKAIVLNHHMKLQSIEAVKRSVRDNLGIAYVPRFSVEEELDNGSLIRLATELDDRLYASVCVFHKDSWISPQMELAFSMMQVKTDIGCSRDTDTGF
ncbi:MAG: LysR family transcriptional regulator [Clostridiales bacterium]|nr:LysR family transcriptional regulator [Clostridiales bacterium]